MKGARLFSPDETASDESSLNFEGVVEEDEVGVGAELERPLVLLDLQELRRVQRGALDRIHSAAPRRLYQTLYAHRNRRHAAIGNVIGWNVADQNQ